MFIKSWKKNILTACLASTLLLLAINASPVIAADALGAQAKAQAMQMAERETQGKSISARFIQTEKRRGFRVRVLKDGKVKHVFIAASRLQ